MSRCLVAIVAAMLLSADIVAQVPVASSTASQSRDSAAIAILERRIEEANVRRDATFLDSVYASSFRFKHSTGDVETRGERLASLRSEIGPDAPGRTLTRSIDSVDVEVHGDIALTSGRIHVRRSGGEARWQNYTIRYVRVYARSGPRGQWLLLTHHSTSDSQGAPPPSRDY
jgi:hypothetical protein